MIIPSSVVQKYGYIEPYLTNVGERVKQTVFAYCEREGFAFAARYKTTESLAEKIETGRFSKWSDLNDLFACTIIIPTLQKEKEALDYLESTFDPVETKVRGTAQKDPSIFHFDSTRFTGRLNVVAEDGNENLSDILFEVQIRSAFEHAWSVTTHALTYKGTEVDWRKIRLAAQLKASVEQLDHLILGFEESAQFISEQNWPEIKAKKTIEEFFRRKFSEREVPSECQPTNWTRFCDNVFSALMSSGTSTREEPSQVVEIAIDALNEEINDLSLSAFPRSISLFQFVLGTLAKAEIISTPLHQYVPFVTPQLSELYPEVNQFENAFNVEPFEGS